MGRYEDNVKKNRKKTDTSESGTGVGVIVSAIILALVIGVAWIGFTNSSTENKNVDLIVITYTNENDGVEVIHTTNQSLEVLQAISDVYEASPGEIDMGRWGDNSYYIACYGWTTWSDFVKDSQTENIKWTSVPRAKFMKDQNIDSFDVFY